MLKACGRWMALLALVAVIAGCEAGLLGNQIVAGGGDRVLVFEDAWYYGPASLRLDYAYFPVEDAHLRQLQQADVGVESDLDIAAIETTFSRDLLTWVTYERNGVEYTAAASGIRLITTMTVSTDEPGDRLERVTLRFPPELFAYDGVEARPVEDDLDRELDTAASGELLEPGRLRYVVEVRSSVPRFWYAVVRYLPIVTALAMAGALLWLVRSARRRSEPVDLGEDLLVPLVIGAAAGALVAVFITILESGRPGAEPLVLLASSQVITVVVVAGSGRWGVGSVPPVLAVVAGLCAEAAYGGAAAGVLAGVPTAFALPLVMMLAAVSDTPPRETARPG